jgi:hypothetical protein
MEILYKWNPHFCTILNNNKVTNITDFYCTIPDISLGPILTSYPYMKPLLYDAGYPVTEVSSF